MKQTHVLWVIAGSVLAIMVLFFLLAGFCWWLFLRALGCWLIVDGTGSICLRHEDLKKYYEPRQALELVYRVTRVCWGLGLVFFGA